MSTRFRNHWTTLASLSLAVAPGLVLGCAREPSMASQSAAAYQDAVEQGLPVGSSHGHGGGETAPDAAAPVPAGGADQTSAPAAGAGHDHDPAAPARAPTQGAPHAHSTGMRAVPRASRPPGGHAAGSHAPAPIGATEPPARADHSAMGHGAAPRAPALPVTAARSSAEMARLNPAATLAADPFDQVAPLSANEAEKGGGEAPPPQEEPS